MVIAWKRPAVRWAARPEKPVDHALIHMYVSLSLMAVGIDKDRYEIVVVLGPL
jgi:hypothetical protein